MHPSEIVPGMSVTINSTRDLMWHSTTYQYITDEDNLHVHQVQHLTKSGLVHIQVGPKEYLTIPAHNVDLWDPNDLQCKLQASKHFYHKLIQLLTLDQIHE